MLGPILNKWRNQDFRKVFFNTTWLLSEKVFRMLAGLVVGIIVARYLGPEQFGVLSYAISLVTMVAMLNHLGLDGLAVRELVKYPEQDQRILGTVFSLKFYASLFAMVVMLGIAWFTAHDDKNTFYLLCIMTLYCLFEPKIIADYWFESKILGRYSTIAKTSALAITSVVRLLLVFGGFNLLWFGGAVVLEVCLVAIFLFVLLKQRLAFPLTAMRFDSQLAKSLLSRGWMVMFGAIFATIYRKVDQAMLMWMSDEKEVGMYAVAAQLSEIWSFVPIAIVASLFPGLVKLKDGEPGQYNMRLQSIFDFLTFLAFGLAICTTLIATPLVIFLYGDAFAAAGPILTLHIWSCLFIFMRALFSKWIHLEQVFLFSMVTQGVGALSNVILNLWLIPLHGGYGAAIATLISYGMASFGVLAFHKKSRTVFWMMSKSLFILVRGPFLIKQFYNKESS